MGLEPRVNGFRVRLEGVWDYFGLGSGNRLRLHLGAKVKG